jgi:hypothetical protein
MVTKMLMKRNSSLMLGHAQLFFSPQSQYRNLKEALPQSQLCSFLEMLIRKSAIAIFSEVRNFKSAT